jgi:hypothetical protein
LKVTSIGITGGTVADRAESTCLRAVSRICGFPYGKPRVVL